MDDRDNEQIAKSPKELLVMDILKQRTSIIREIEQYNKYNYRNAYYPDSDIRSKVKSLFLTLKPSLKRHKDKLDEEITQINNWIDTGDIDELMKAFEILDDFLDDLQVTKFDTITKHNYQDVEEDNLSAGFY